MKKFFKNKIKSILTVSTNRTGISLDKIKENFPFEFHKDKVELLLNEDNDVIKNKEKTNQTTDNFNYSLIYYTKKIIYYFNETINIINY